MKAREYLVDKFDIGEYTDEMYYIATDGLDTNDGLSADKPCLTLSHILSLIDDVLTCDIVINLADGDYPEEMTISGFSGEGSLSLVGNTPTNVTVPKLTITTNSCLVKIQGISGG